MRLPIRMRLTLAFALSMAVLLAVAGAFLYQRLASELRTSTDSSLRAQADVLASGIGQGRMAFGDTSGEAVQEGQPFAQVLTRGGRVLESTELIAARGMLPAEALQSLRGPAFFERAVPGIEGVSRIYAVPVRDEGQPVVIAVGSSLSNREEILSRFVLLLSVGGPLALLIASGIGWMIAGAALRPVERMRQEASAISVSDRSRRLPVPETCDEIARLGLTLNSMLDRMQHAFERERRFVDDASHELRTPLTILRAELDLALSRARSPEEIEAALRSAIEEADRLSALADELLVYSRSEDGRAPVNREPVRIDRLVLEVTRSFTERAAACGVQLDAEAPEAVALLDATRCRQALANVIDNALRHTPSGGWVQVRATLSPGEVRLTVDDSGTGFDTELVPVAFEPFSRGSTERAIAAPGAGLGLAIVQEVAAAHGGRAVAENRAEGGARVTVVLHSES